MSYTLQKQHFHKAKLMSIFWSESDNANCDRKSLISGFQLNEYFYSIMKNEDKDINSFCRPYKSENFMFSYFIFNETETTLKVNEIENNFENLCQELLMKEQENPSYILNHPVTTDERKIILQFFCLQYVRNPDRYIDYQNLYFSHLMTTPELFNPYHFDLFDFRNLEKFLVFSNNTIISKFFSKLNFFNHYCFKIFENKNNNNILTDNCIINLNQNDYCKSFYKEQFDKLKDYFNNIHIMVINETYSIIFYPERTSQHIHIFEKIYLDHQLLINLFSSRNIVFKKNNKQSLFDDINTTLSNCNTENVFLKNYMDLNFSRDQLEHHITSFHNFKSKGFSY